MREIDQMLEQWIPVNTIIREEIREAIVIMKMEAMDRAFEKGRALEIHCCPHHKNDTKEKIKS
jgi:hypothetical protein